MFFIDALLRHNIFPLQHWVQRRGALLEALYRISEGFFFGPHHLIMAALLYFEEKVHQKKLLRADAIPLLFPRLAGAPVGVEHPEIPHAEQPQELQPIETPADTRAPAPVVPSAEPIPEVAPSASPATPQPSPVFHPHHSPPLQQSRGLPYPFPRANYCYSDSAYCHSEANSEPSGYSISPQHQMPAPLEPTEPTPGDTQTST
ncbi:hypothetical protein CK203_113140 [Vitis vinifera]|uniref:Uncharacterized protein n=1 Tax=Vitis vinifera TaxID=29760 RepID=A0A438DNN0_VITVI|nr:hypothetical protein CK203_113140 [Vitis vinifera]